MSAVCVAVNDASAVKIIQGCFSANQAVETVSEHAALKAAMHRRPFDYVFVDIDLLQERRSNGGSRTLVLDYQAVQKISPGAYIIVMTPVTRIREAVDLVKAGASNYLTYPLLPDEVKYVIESIHDYARMELELTYLRNRLGVVGAGLIDNTNSPLMQSVYDKVNLAAPTNALILLTGETGTGKSVIARLIHQRSPRHNNQFISVHCGAILDTLIESELFGHEKGAFTGAVRRKLGRFELAHKGTIFLDEIATITPATQVKLLHVLQDRTFQRVGGEVTLETDARVVASSNKDLKKMVEQGEFRSDLYYRLNVFPIEIPPLRHRKEDIPLLIDFFIRDLKTRYPKEIDSVAPEVIRAFESYDWPGNVRELENLIERAYILETTSTLSPESFPGELFTKSAPAACLPLDTSMTLAAFRELAKENAERQYLREVLGQCKGRINRSAERAGISTRQLNKLLTRYNIRKQEFK